MAAATSERSTTTPVEAADTFDAAQAQQIIAETEAMVTELLEKARLQAQEIIEAARGEAEKLRQAVRLEVEQVRQTAREEGYRQGREQILQEMAAEREASRNAAQRVVAQALREREKMLAELEPELVKLALAIAKKVIHAELKQSPDLVVQLAKAALQKVNGTSEVTIRVHPSQKGILEEQREQLDSEGFEYRLINIEADPAIEPGGCIVDTGAGYVDAQISQQLKSLEGALLRVSDGG